MICLTDNDKTNILASVLGKKLGARHTIALLNEQSMQDLQKDLGIDMVIDPRASTVSSILRHVRRGRILDVYMLDQGAADVLEGEVLETSVFAGKTLSEAAVKDGVAIGAIVRDGRVMMPEPSLMLKEGDRVVLMAERSALRDIEALFRVGVELY
jgi:trk system potassium uptake protein TrkA